MTIRGINTRVEVQETLGAAKTISGVTAANPPVFTAATHGFTVGDIVRITMTAGMPQMDGMAARITAADTNSFTLGGIDASGWSAGTAGSAEEVTAWDEFDSLLSISIPEGEPTRLPSQTVHDGRARNVLGLAGALSGSMTGKFAPQEAAVVNVRAASRASESRVFRITFETGDVAVFNADVSGGTGFDLQGNAIATASYALELKNEPQYYAPA